jgi:GT2 family glycosyltransferase
MGIDITISIINTNNRELTLQCLQSIFETAGDLKLEIFVVNNGCEDRSAESIQALFPQVRLIENSTKLGFSTNNNMVFERASGRYLMLLNDDTIVQPGAFGELVEFLDQHPEAAVAGANLFNPDNSWQLCYGREPNPFYEGLRPFSEKFLPIERVYDEPKEVADVCGACMLVRSSAAEQVGLLDTRFDPLYSEEIDWCYRFRKAGWKVFHIPNAGVIHLGGVTMANITSNRIESIYEKKALFFRKHHGKIGVAFYKSSLLISNFIKSLYWIILALWKRNNNDPMGELKTHWNLVRRALFL